MQSKSSTRSVPDLPDDARIYFEAVLEEAPPDRFPHFWQSDEDGREPLALSWVWAPEQQTQPPHAFFASLSVVDSRLWLLRGRLEVKAGVARVRQLTIEPWEHELEVTSAALRQFRVAELRDRALSHMRLRARTLAAVPALDALFRSERPLITYATEAERPRRGRPGLPDDHYRGVAIAYLELFESGVSRGILDRLATKYGRPRETVRDWVRRSRELGFLTTPGTQGRAGAEPGPRLLAERQRGEDDA